MGKLNEINNETFQKAKTFVLNVHFSLTNVVITMPGVSGRYRTSDLLIESWVPEGATGIPMYKLNQLHCIRIKTSKGR